MFEEKLVPKDKTEIEKDKIKIETEPDPKAREIAHLGDFDLIKQKLEEEGLLEKERERTKEGFSQLIEASDFPTKNEKLWDLLTILELYDQETALHSILTYQIAKEKIEKVLSKNIMLSKMIESEGVELERFYFACLTHDIGKVEIPHFVIQNSLSKEQWEEKLQEILASENYPKTMLSKLGLGTTPKPAKPEIEERIKSSCLCTKEIIPIKNGLTEKEIEQLEKDWKISAETPLMDIIEKHADISGRILEREGFPVVAKIVKEHHHKQASPHTVSIESLQISSDMSDIIHLADVEQALSDIRHYKESFAPSKVIGTLIDHAEEGKIGKEITYLWVKDCYEKLQKEAPNISDLEETKNLKKIEAFIGKFESGEDKQDLDNWIAFHLGKQKISA
jgi:hypothetical protein